MAVCIRRSLDLRPGGTCDGELSHIVYLPTYRNEGVAASTHIHLPVRRNETEVEAFRHLHRINADVVVFAGLDVAGQDYRGGIRGKIADGGRLHCRGSAIPLKIRLPAYPHIRTTGLPCSQINLLAVELGRHLKQGHEGLERKVPQRCAVCKHKETVPVERSFGCCLVCIQFAIVIILAIPVSHECIRAFLVWIQGRPSFTAGGVDASGISRELRGCAHATGRKAERHV